MFLIAAICYLMMVAVLPAFVFLCTRKDTKRVYYHRIKLPGWRDTSLSSPGLAGLSVSVISCQPKDSKEAVTTSAGQQDGSDDKKGAQAASSDGASTPKPEDDKCDAKQEKSSSSASGKPKPSAEESNEKVGANVEAAKRAEKSKGDPKDTTDGCVDKAERPVARTTPCEKTDSDIEIVSKRYNPKIHVSPPGSRHRAACTSTPYSSKEGGSPPECSTQSSLQRSTQKLPLTPPMVHIEPTEVTFPKDGGVSRHLLINSGPDRLAFKVKTTNNMNYTLNPVFGFVEPLMKEPIEVQCDGGPMRRDRMEVCFKRAPPDATHPRAVFTDNAYAGVLKVTLRVEH